MPNDASTKSEYQDVYEINNTHWQPFNQQACLDNDFYLKAQHSIDEMNKADDQNRILHTIDKIGRQVNLVHGYEIRNRHILKIGEQGNFDQQEDQACNQHTGVIMSQMASRGGYDVLSEAFKWGTLVQGSNLVEQWRDRDGLIQYGRLAFNQFLLDAGTVKSDLSDCGDILTGQWISSEKAKMLVPTRADEIDKITPLTSSPRWTFQSQPTMNNKAGKRLFEQWWHRTTEEIPIVINRITGEQTTFKEFKDQFFGGDSKLANRAIKETMIPGTETPQLIKVRDIKDKVELKIIVDDELVWTGDNPTKLRDFNYSWMHGNWCPECPRSELKLQSFVRGQRDPQRMYNRKINQAMDIIESQMQGFRMVRDKYLRNPEDAYKSGQGAVLHANDEMPDEMPLNQIFNQSAASEVPQSIFQMLSVIDKDQTESGGLNQEIFGSDDKNVEISGVLAQYRTGQALTGQAWMFQILRQAKRDMGRKQVQIIQLNYPPQLVQKMINEPPVEGFYNEDLTRFDCVPTEGLLTDSQQNMYYQELKDLLKTFPEMFSGVITPQMLVAASPMQFKTPTLKAIEQAAQGRQQQQQQAAQQAQVDQQLQQAVTGLQVAQGIESLADAAEKRSQIPLNAAKTMSEINKNKAGALAPIVDLVKEQVKLEIAQSKQTQNVGQGV
jgi:hypothetical protein